MRLIRLFFGLGLGKEGWMQLVTLLAWFKCHGETMDWTGHWKGRMLTVSLANWSQFGVVFKSRDVRFE